MGQKRNSQKPNIIWIMADDLSWGDLGCYGQDKIKTPNIDRLAENGIRFTHCYSGSTVCAPSRSSLMQGLHQGHATVRYNMQQGYRHSLQSEDITVAQLLKDAGYSTGLFGKWGLAVGNQPGIPNNMGFDSFFGYLNQRKAHNYYPEYLWQNRKMIHYPQHVTHNHKQPNKYDESGRVVANGIRDQESLRYSFDEYTRESLGFVRENYKDPFFLYLAYTIPHPALEVPELGEYTNLNWPTIIHKVYAAMVTRMDTAIGELIELLKELDVYENTLIFFTSDNGYSFSNYSVNPSLNSFFQHRGPWRGSKGNLYQGGLRVPAIAHWPGRIEPGSESNQVWAFWDFLPTVAEIVGTQIDLHTDGISILPTLLRNSKSQQQHEYLYWEYGDEQSLRMGKWYIYRSHPNRSVEVYEADNDPRQSNDLASEKPKVVRCAKEIFSEEHTPSLYVRSPGESQGSWEKRLEKAEVKLPRNVDTW